MIKFKIGDTIKYDGLSGVIINFYKETENYKNVFLGEFNFEDTVKYLLFDKEGYVKPFTEKTNQPKVEKI